MTTPTPTAEQRPTVSDIPGTPEFAEKHPITSKAHLQFMLWVLKDAAVTTEQKLAHMLQKPANGWQVSAALERRNAELAEALAGAQDALLALCAHIPPAEKLAVLTPIQHAYNNTLPVLANITAALDGAKEAK